MAVNDESTTNTGTQQAAPAPQAQQQQYVPPTQNAQPNKAASTGRRNINDRMRRSATVTGNDVRSADALTTFTQAAKTSIEQQLVEETFHVYRFERVTHEVGMSSILIAKVDRGVNGRKPTIAIRTLILQNDSDRLPNVETPIHGPSGSIVETLSRRPNAKDVLTADYWNRLSAYVRSQLGLPDAITHTAGATVIPGSFVFKDQADRVQNILLAAINTCEDTLQRLQGEQPFSIEEDIKNENEVLQVKMDFSGKPVYDSVGTPLRADILVSMHRSDKSKARTNEYFEADTELNQVALAVGLEYMPVAQAQTWGGAPQQQLPGATAPFTPTLTITDVRPAPWIQAHTLEMHIFALLNPFLTTYQQSWAKALVPDVNGKKLDARDIGALGYVLEPARTKIETKGATFTPAHFAELMQLMVKPNPIFLIDLNRIGDSSALDLFFLDAMGEGPNKAKANAALNKACLNLLGKTYLNHFNPEVDWIVRPYGTEITVGSYIDSKGEKQPATDLDLLMAMNLSQGNQQEFQSYYATLADDQQHPEIRMRNRENMEDRFLGNSIERVSRMDRGILNPKWILAINAASKDAGLTVAMENVTSVFGGKQFRGNAGIMQYAVGSTATLAQAGTGGYGFSTTGAVGMLYQ